MQYHFADDFLQHLVLLFDPLHFSARRMSIFRLFAKPPSNSLLDNQKSFGRIRDAHAFIFNRGDNLRSLFRADVLCHTCLYVNSAF